MKHLRLWFAVAAVLAVAVAVPLGSARASAWTGHGVVRVPHGQPVQIAVVVDTKSPSIGGLGVGVLNAIDMAVGQRTIRGFPIQLNVFDVPALVVDDPNAIADNAATAQQVVSNAQNVAVLGHEASLTFGDVQPPNGS